MDRSRSLVVTGCLLVAAVSRTQEPAASLPERVPALAFAWPVPCSVQVTKVGEKGGHVAKLRYWVDVERGTGGELRVRQHDFEFLEVNGKDATTPAMREALEPALALAQAVPDLVVDAQGGYLRIDGLEAMVERVNEFAGRRKGQSEAERMRTLQAMLAPQARSALEQACGADWAAWVGVWRGCSLAPGQEVEVPVTKEFFGAELSSRQRIRHCGTPAEHAGKIHLTAVAVFEGPEHTKAIAAAVAKMAEAGSGVPFDASRLESVWSEISIATVTDPSTLRPARASRTKRIRITAKGEEPREQVERAEFTFDWDAKKAK